MMGPSALRFENDEEMMGCYRTSEHISASDYNNIKDASSQSLMEEQAHLTRSNGDKRCAGAASASLVLQRVPSQRRP